MPATAAVKARHDARPKQGDPGWQPQQYHAPKTDSRKQWEAEQVAEKRKKEVRSDPLRHHAAPLLTGLCCVRVLQYFFKPKSP